MNEPVRVLFVCSRNQWRSPTAERVFRNDDRLAVRSGGTSKNARRTVSEADIRWADVVVVMEGKHRDRLRAEHARAMQFKHICVLDIPDEYHFMAPELVDLLAEVVPAAIFNS